MCSSYLAAVCACYANSHETSVYRTPQPIRLFRIVLGSDHLELLLIQYEHLACGIEVDPHGEGGGCLLLIEEQKLNLTSRPRKLGGGVEPFYTEIIKASA